MVVTASEQSTWEWWFSCVSLFESFRREVKFYNPSFIDLFNFDLHFYVQFLLCQVICSSIWIWKFIDNFAGSIFIEKKLELKPRILAAWHLKIRIPLIQFLKDVPYLFIDYWINALVFTSNFSALFFYLKTFELWLKNRR